MTLIERMDQFVHVTRLDRLTMIDRPQPRLLRWLPLLVLAAMIGGYWLMTATIRHAVADHVLIGRPLIGRILAGGALFFGGFLAANLMRFFGPRLVPGPNDRLDERELMVKARAGAISGAIVTVAAIAGCFYMGVTDVFGWWRPRTGLEWTYLGFGLEGAAFILPVWVASWLQPRPAEGD